MMIVLLGNYLRHAVTRAVARRDGRDQPSSVPTTETNDTISPG